MGPWIEVVGLATFPTLWGFVATPALGTTLRSPIHPPFSFQRFPDRADDDGNRYPRCCRAV